MNSLKAITHSIYRTAKIFFLVPFFLLLGFSHLKGQQNIRQYGVEIGILEPGEQNAITDVAGVQVGHQTLIEGDSIRTGVTAILPHPGNIFQQKVPGAVYVGNGFGKLAGSTQVEELGTIETPIILTNTLSVPTAANGLIDYTFTFEENSSVRSVNPVVGETNDGYLNDIRGRHVTEQDVLKAIRNASGSIPEQGNVGAGTGTIAFGFKGGIGTSSRTLPEKLGGLHDWSVGPSQFRRRAEHCRGTCWQRARQILLKRCVKRITRWLLHDYSCYRCSAYQSQS